MHIDCYLERIGDGSHERTLYRCIHCGRKYESKNPPHKIHLICKAARCGVGTELKKILVWFGEAVKPNVACGCELRAAEMDNRGVAWCNANRRVIVRWLMEEWDRRSLCLEEMIPQNNRLLRLARLAMKTLDRQQQRKWAERGAGLAVKLAVRRAEKSIKKEQTNSLLGNP